MKIGNIQIKNGLILAPMAGVTDYSFRLLCKEFKAELMVSEMVSAKALHFKDKKTAEIARITDFERPMAIQIFGSEPDIMAEGAQILQESFKPDIIDINMGCPVPKVVNNGEGSALMKNPELAGRIVRAVVNAVSTPVTVKIRSGWDEKNINAIEIAQICEENGAAALAIHGRTRSQMYAPPVNRDIIRDVKKAISIPVIGNGGINNSEDAIRMFEYTGCDGIMIARGAMGNPWIFDEIHAALDGKDYIEPSVEERLMLASRHLDLMINDKGPKIGICEARKHLAWYIKGLKGAASARVRINAAETPDEVNDILHELIKYNI